MPRGRPSGTGLASVAGVDEEGGSGSSSGRGRRSVPGCRHLHHAFSPLYVCRGKCPIVVHGRNIPRVGANGHGASYGETLLARDQPLTRHDELVRDRAAIGTSPSSIILDRTSLASLTPVYRPSLGALRGRGEMPSGHHLGLASSPIAVRSEGLWLSLRSGDVPRREFVLCCTGRRRHHPSTSAVAWRQGAWAGPGPGPTGPAGSGGRPAPPREGA